MLTRMWWLPVVLYTIVSAARGSTGSTPECDIGVDCLHSPGSVDETYYNIDGGKLITIQSNDVEFTLNCNKHDVDHKKLPHLLDLTEFDKVIFVNCSYPSTVLWEVLKQLRLKTKSIVLDRWTPDEEGAFVGLEELKVLSLNEVNITRLPTEALSGLTNLTKLHITSSNLTLLTGINFPQQLTFLNLSNNGLKIVPEDFLQNKSALETLILSNNGIQSLPNKIFVQSQLKVLDLSVNGITEIPHDLLSPLHSLRELYLSANNISELRNNIFENMQNLKLLHLDNNFIEVLPSEVFQWLSKLETLNVSHNRLNRIEQYVFPNTVTTLDLSHNNLTDLCPKGPSVLNALHRLQSLSLHHNRLYHSCLSFTQLTELRLLDFSHNLFPNLTYDDFNYIGTNLTVDYRSNGINSIEFIEENLNQTTKLKSKLFLLEGNPLICDRYMYWFVRMAKENDFIGTTIEDIKCESPLKLANRRLSSLQLGELTYQVECNSVIGMLEKCICEYHEEKHEFTVNCSSIASPNIAEFRTKPEMYRVVLVLENCNLSSLPEPLPKNLTALYAAHNHIKQVPELPKTLEYVDLSYNEVETAQRLLTGGRVSLQHNPLACDCQNREQIVYMQTHRKQMVAYEELRCGNGSRVSSFLPSLACGAPWSGLWLALAAGAAALVLLLLGAACFIYRYEVKVILYSLGCDVGPEEEDEDKVEVGKGGEEGGGGYLYDAFVSYAHGDEAFVVGELLPTLEGGAGPRRYRLCVHHRDWLPGNDIPSQILQSVQLSRRTIIVLSQHFLESVWGRAEFRAAATAHCGLPRVLAILLHDLGSAAKLDPELKAYLDTNTYLARQDPLFWEKLRFALPHPRRKETAQFLRPMTQEQQKRKKKRLKSIEKFVQKEFALREKDKGRNVEMGVVNPDGPADDLKRDVVENDVRSQVTVENEVKDCNELCSKIRGTIDKILPNVHCLSSGDVKG